MAFRIRKDVEDWFKHIADKDPIRTKFDIYYLCLMMGLASGSKSPPAECYPEVTEFVDNFVVAYRPVQELIVGLLVSAEVGRLGLDLQDKSEVRKLILDYVDPTNPAHMSDEGFRQANEYSSGGYDYLVEHSESPPYHHDEFLQSYAGLLKNASEKNRVWQES